MSYIKTKLVTFAVDSNAEYKALKAANMADGVKPMESFGFGRVVTAGDVWLDTAHLFSNQWNTHADSPTNPNTRVFDWHGAYDPRNGRNEYPSGHYLIVTDEMRVIRNNTYKCGYCGKYSSRDDVFCKRCLGSEYLSEGDLDLLRLMPVSFDGSRAPLTGEELATLKPLYLAAQLKAADVRTEEERHAVIKKRDAAIKKRDAAIAKAQAECDGMIWLMDNGIKTDNCIYYDHTGVFCFGWRRGLCDDEKAQLTEALADFPAKYELK